ncbi:DNA polymerase III subunit epsilon [Acinetobacter sp. ESL0695]|uniref:DNA polymerase III subunit epsilon n=1 Tax=Acinetobacter sp. ESL0695 TaxID=2983215 RepID=UPI0023F0CB8B|nr:DNA polymerase III subunit epsilon [Acinetobacter sp. ESL0695]WEV48310.1 DNA polymerase III subunit epsilon [Acinetobacter sp. ESL0695]
MSQTITLYVDGACRGNPGLGGWGAYIIMPEGEHKLSGGAKLTTNNRMELTAAIEGVQFCPVDAKLIIWTDSNYVKQGITEWIHGWKKKNWKDVKNPDLWQKLDEVCQQRNIEWNWIKGHAGHEGNEMADQLANKGADDFLKDPNAGPAHEFKKKKIEDDWILDDPFGFDLHEKEEDTDHIEHQVDNSIQHPHIKITPQEKNIHGPRQLILDTETTGFYFQDGDRIIEVGAVEMINRKLTGSSIHIYINPEKPVGDSVEVHGITDEFLADKPKYQEISQTLFEYLKGAEIIAHNASFDMNFLNMEFERAGFQKLSDVCQVTDTLAMAKNKHPGQKNSLDALVRRYEIPARDRTYHGALLDAEILADVYLAMTGGQVAFDMDTLSQDSQNSDQIQHKAHINVALPVIYALDSELEAHEAWLEEIAQKNGEPSIFAKLG